MNHHVLVLCVSVQSSLDIRTVEVPALPAMASKLYMLVMSVVFGLLTKTGHCGTHLDKPWFNWEGGKVPFYFNVSISDNTKILFNRPFHCPVSLLQATVTNDDRIMMRHMMKEIEKKTCLRFSEKSRVPSGHHLEIRVLSTTSCVQQGRPRFSAAVYAEPPTNQKVQSYYSILITLYLLHL